MATSSTPLPHMHLGLLIATLIPLVFLGCGSDDNSSGPQIRHPQDFLIRGDLEGWEMDEGTLQTASTIPELRDTAVNGDGFVYELHNFEEWAGAGYEGTVESSAAVLSVWIFELQTTADALALYNDSENNIAPPTSEPPDQQIGDEARIWQAGLFTKVLDFVRGKYWVKLSINNTSDDAEYVLQLFGASVDQKIVD